MASKYTRRINLYINGKKVRNDISSIRKEMMRLQNQQARMIVGSKEYNAQTTKIRNLKQILQDHNASLRKTKTNLFSIRNLAEKANHYFGLLTATIGAFVAVIAGFRKASDAVMSFEERLDNLSALTGLEGRQLEWLGNKAKEMSIATVEGNIKIKQSADDVVDAYTKMGSQRPELLQNKEALQAVTQDAIILSEAAKDKLEPSVKALAMALNQHAMSANDSRRAINALAAGSKMGAGDIPYLTAAIEKSGTSLSLMGISLEENIALIETIAPNYTQASMAGNSLDKTFLRLKQDQIGYTNGVFNLNDAIEELKYRFSQGETAVDIFGVRHAKMAELLVKKSAGIQYFTDAVTGTDIALEQASKNTNNRAQTLAQAKNRLTLTLIKFGEKINPIFLKSTNLVTYLIKALMQAPKIIKENELVLIAITGALISYNHALLTNVALNTKGLIKNTARIISEKALAVASTANVTIMKIRILLSQKNTAAQIANINALKQRIMYEKLFNKAVAANPLGAALAVMTAAVIAIKAYDKYNKRAVENEKFKLSTIRELNAVNEFYKKDLKEIGSQMSNLNRLSNARKDKLQNEIDRTIKLAEAELTLQKTRQLEIQERHSQATAWEKVLNVLQAGGNAYIAHALNIADGAENGAKAASAMDNQINKLEETLAGFKRQKLDLNEILNAEANADNIGTDTIVNIEEKLSLYQTALKNAVRESEDWIRINRKVNETEAELAAARAERNKNADPEAQYKEAKKALEAHYLDEQNLLKENLLTEKITKIDFNNEMYALEFSHLESMLLLNHRFGKQTAEFEAQLLDKRLAKKEEINKMFQTLDTIQISSNKSVKEKEKEKNQFEAKMMQKALDRSNASTEKIRKNEESKISAKQKMIDFYVESSVNAGAAAIEEAETMEEAGKAILNTIRDQIKAYLAEAVATQVVQILKSVPFPFNIAVATAAGGATAFLFNKLVPKFAAGGFTDNASLYMAGEKGSEWIAPNWMVSDPDVSPILDALENLRLNKNTLNPAVQQLPSSTSTVNQINSGNDVDQVDLMQQQVQVLGALVQTMDELRRKKYNIDITTISNKLNELKDIELNSGFKN